MSKILTYLLVIGFLAAAAPATVSFNWVQVGTDVGGGDYDSYDLMMEVDSNIAQIQMYIESDSPAAGDFYQDTGNEFDTYTILPESVTGDTIGCAINILGGERSYVFDDLLLDIAWGVNGGETSGAGTYQVARVTVKQGLLGTWDVWGQETGTIPLDEYTDSGTSPLYSTPAWILGDANHDGEVTAGDFTTVQGTYGNVGAPGILGDANLDGEVTAGDFTTIQGTYGNVAEPPAPVPEPATIGLLALGLAAVICKRK